MNRYIQLGEFTRSLFDSEPQAQRVAVVLTAMLATQSPRISAISQAMPGNPQANSIPLVAQAEAAPLRRSSAAVDQAGRGQVHGSGPPPCPILCLKFRSSLPDLVR